MKKKMKRCTCMLIAVMVSISTLMGLSVDSKVLAATESMIGNYTNYTSEDGNVLIFNNENAQVKVELCTARTVRVQLSLDGTEGYRPEDPQYYMVQKNEWPLVEKTVTDQGDYIQILTEAIEIRVQKNPFRVGMYDLDGNLISKDADDQGIYWNDAGIRGVKKVEGQKNTGGIFGFGSGDHGRRSELNRYNTDFSEFSMSHGKVVAPFFMSTVGYGMFLNTIEKDTMFFKHGGGFQTKGYLDYYFMYGPDFKTILNEYAEITGRMEMYGKWAHGFMLSKYGNDNATQEEFLQWIHRLRDEDYPSDCYVFDFGWRGDIADNGGNQTGAGEKWGKQMWSNDTTKFPDIAAMFEEADELGFRVGLHNNAGTPEASGGAELYKPENEEKWVKSYMDSVITTGYGDWFWPDEFDVLGSNTAPTFSSKGAYEAWQEYTDQSRPMFITRGSYGGQHYATAWSGDINPTSQELINQIGFSIDTGLIGYWTTSHDLGGFMKRPTNELYTRWVAEFGAWNGIMRTHGHDGREPWDYDETAQQTLRENLKIRYSLYPYTYSLAWQGYSQGVPIMRAMLLEDDSQYNPEAWNLNEQYYYGDCFLVAPAADTKDTVVSIWLPPKTTWYNYYSGERYEGGENGKTIRVVASLDEIPVFVKAGAIVPMGPDVDYADEKPLDPLTLDIYPKGESTFTLYEDDGQTREYITKNAYTTTKFDCVVNGNEINFKVNERMNGNAEVYTPVDRNYNLKFNHIENLDNVLINGLNIEKVTTLDEYNNATQAYWLDTENNFVYVKTEDTGKEINIKLSGVIEKEVELGEEEQSIPPQKIKDGDVFELEEAKMYGSVSVDTEWKGYTGTGFAKGFKTVGDAVEFSVDVQRAGDYNLVLNVNNGKKNDSKYDNSPRQGTMYLNGQKLQEMEFEITDTWGETVNGIKQGVWVKYTIENVPLEAGVNTFKFVAEGDNNPGNYNLDSLTFNRIDRSVDAFSQIEAENANAYEGFTIIDDISASNGKIMSTNLSGSWLEFSEVKGEDKGGIAIKLKSSTGGKITVYENGIGDKILTTLDIPNDNQWRTLEVISKDTDAVESGIFLKFDGIDEANFQCDVDWFHFDPKLPEINSGDIFELENGEGVTDSSKNQLRVDTEWKGYSGTGYVAGWKNVGNYVEFNVDIKEAGIYNLVLNAGCGKKGSSNYDDTPRTGALYINDEKRADFGVEVTPAWGDSQKNGVWNEVSINNISLEAGRNKIMIRSEGDINPGNFNLDYMRFDKVEIDKTELQSLYNQCLTLNETDYTAKSWAEFKTVMDEAKVVLDNVIATQEEVDNAKATLQTAKDALVKAEVSTNKTALSIAIEMAENADLENVVPVVIEEFNEALTNAQTIYANANASQEEIDNAFARLANAMWMLQFYQGDKTELEALIKQVEGLEANKYTVDSWQALNEALQTAKDVMDDENALQEEVDKVVSDLQAALDNLVEVEEVNKSFLEAMVNRVLGLDASKYTSETWDNLVPVLKTAQDVLADPDVTQSDVDNAHNALVTAYLNLRLIPNKDLLAGLINEANGLNAANYTAKTWGVMTNALEEATAVLANPEASQAKVDAAKDVLAKAVAGLQAVDTVKARDTTASVKTGDDFDAELTIVLMSLSVLGSFILRKRRYLN